MTRGEVKRRLRTTGGEAAGSPGASEHSGVLNEDIQTVVDEIALRRFAYYVEFKTGVVDGTSVYCVPNLFKLMEASILDSSGNWAPLRCEGVEYSDYARQGQWRNDAEGDPSRVAIFRGANQIILNPTPSVTRLASLKFAGFAQPGIYWSYDVDGAGVAITDSSDVPLATWAQSNDIIIDRLRAIRAERYGDYARADRYMASYEKKMTSIDGKVADFFQSPAFAGDGVFRYGMS